MICDTTSRASSLSPTGTTDQGQVSVLVALKHFFVRDHVLRPELALFDVGCAEYPVLVRLVDASEKALALFLFREMQEVLHDARIVAMEMAIEFSYGTIPAVSRRPRQTLSRATAPHRAGRDHVASAPSRKTPNRGAALTQERVTSHPADIARLSKELGVYLCEFSVWIRSPARNPMS